LIYLFIYIVHNFVGHHSNNYSCTITFVLWCCMLFPFRLLSVEVCNASSEHLLLLFWVCCSNMAGGLFASYIVFC